jgi:hypothetical protein
MNKTALAGVALASILLLAGCGTAAQPAPDSAEDKYPGGTYDGAKTNCLVTDKTAVGRVDEEGNNTTDYRVFTANCDVFGVQDDPFIGQWNSASTYGSIIVGETYDFEAYGWRNGFFSTFPNIKKAYLVETPAPAPSETSSGERFSSPLSRSHSACGFRRMVHGTSVRISFVSAVTTRYLTTSFREGRLKL